MKFTASCRIYILGALWLAGLTVCARSFGDRGGPVFLASLLVAGLAYLFAVRELFSISALPRKVVVTGLVLAAVSQALFLRLPPGPDDDVHRYVWDGRLQRLGYNPYLVIPSDPAVQSLHTTETRSLNNPDMPSPYPPGAEVFFRGVTAVHESTRALRIAFVLCAWGIMFLLLDLLRLQQNGSHLVLVYAWNPLLAIEVAGSGHIDIVGALLLIASAVALVRRWRALAAIALALAIAVKFLPIVLLPLYWKRIRLRDAVLGVVVAVLLYLPFLDHWRLPTGSLGAYVQGFRFNGPVFAILHKFLPAQCLVALAVVVGWAVAIWIRRIEHEWSSSSVAWPMAASLWCAPVVFPWYLLWLLPLFISRRNSLLTFWTVSIIPVYVMWHLRAKSGVWGALPTWAMVLEYGCLFIAAVYLAISSQQVSNLHRAHDRLV